MAGQEIRPRLLPVRQVRGSWSLGLVVILSIACGGASQNLTSEQAQTLSRSIKTYRPGSVIGFQVVDAKGKSVGRTRSLLRKTKSGTLQVRTRIVLPNESREYAVSFDKQRSLLRYKQLSSVHGRYEIDFRGDKLTVFDNEDSRKIIGTPGKVLPLPADALMFFSLALQDRELKPGGSLELKYYDVAKLREATTTLSTYLDATQRMTLSWKDGVATLDENGHVIRFENAEGLIFRQAQNPSEIPGVSYKRRLAYRPPSSPAWKDQRVKIGSRKGSLSIPEKLSRWPRLKAPLVVVLSGKGNQDRYGLTEKIDYGTWEIQNHLLEQGYAVLRVDDGPEIESTESLKELFQFMMRQSEIDAEKIIVLGHGQGAWMSLQAGILFPSSVFAVGLLASPWMNAPAAVKKELKKTKFPVAVFQGLKDIEVSWKKESRVLIRDLQARSVGKRFVYSKYYNRVDHLMKEEPKSSSQARYEDRSRRVERQFLLDLTEWLDSLNAKAAGP